ncbi:MAG: vWA domain-containing protein [Solirubrobacterales bacterium]
MRVGLVAALTALLLMAGLLSPRDGIAQSSGECGALDVVLALDRTGSMGGALNNVKSEIGEIINRIDTASGGDFALGYLTFTDDVEVQVDLARNNADAVRNAINATTLGSGGATPEASDETLRTVVNGLKASDRPAGRQTGDFNGSFRSGATKIIVLITDAPPAGFDDEYKEGEDDVNARQRARDAEDKNIRISAVYVPRGTSPVARDVMQDYARISNGLFRETNSDGTGTASAIDEVVRGCGGATEGDVRKPQLRLKLTPRRTTTGTLKCFRALVRARVDGELERVNQARVSLPGGKSKLTNSKGRVTLCRQYGKAGLKRAFARKSGSSTGRSSVRVVRRASLTG